MNFDIQIPNPLNAFAEIEGTWGERKRYWNWNGTIIAKEPIVAISLMRVGSRVVWGRSGKNLTPKLDVNFCLGIFDSDPKDVQTTFFIDRNGPQWRTLLDNPEKPPEILPFKLITVGTPFIFCKPFETPEIELFGLILLREQVVGARNGLGISKRITEKHCQKNGFKFFQSVALVGLTSKCKCPH